MDFPLGVLCSYDSSASQLLELGVPTVGIPAPKRAQPLGTISAASWGFALILPISYTYIAMMGSKGLTEASKIATLNANYMAKRFESHYPILFRGVNGTVAHEFIIDLRAFKVSQIILFLWIPNSTNVNVSAIFVIFVAGRLGFAKYGARSLAIADDNSFEYDDVIVYKGQFYVIDTLVNVSWIDNSSLKLVPFLRPLCGLGSQKHLVESRGALYVVDRYFNKERRRVEHTNRYVRDCDGPKVVDFKVYKLDEEWVVWNPWDKKSKSMVDFGDEEYKQMLCVDGAAIEKPITLKPEEEMTGRLQLSVLPSSFCSKYLNF
uniref:Uncharacterized protein n=1 Tax=Quercus lobata TaxID=97700 RepID=A0A7N2MRV6_QUELO